MKRMYQLASLIMLLLSPNSQSFAQNNHKDSLNFSGNIVNLGNSRPYETVTIFSDRNDWFNASDSAIVLKARIDKGGNFQFKLPNLHKPYKINMVIKNDENEKVWSNLFYTEPNDDIKFRIVQNRNVSSANFSGNGFEKYELAVELERQYWRQYFPELELLKLHTIKDSVALGVKMEELANLLRRYKIRKSYLLNKALINKGIRTIINYELAAYDNEWRWRTQLLYRNPDLQKFLSLNYLLHSREFFLEPNEWAIYCPSYITELVSKNIFDLRIETKANKVDVKELYNLVKTDYLGLVKDRLIGRILTHHLVAKSFHPYKLSTMDSITKDAYQVVTIPYVKQALKKKIQEIGNLQLKVIETIFFGLDGSPFNLRSLIGKVILLEVWFNGCFGCAEFHKKFKEIYPKFQDNKDFVVLSVNVDKENTRWVKGIESKLYTSEKYINVTTKNWFDHPFMKYYNITGASYVMLIDAAGEIIPKPKSYTELIEKITIALNNINDKSSE